jgi:hypothetical protein
MRIHRFRQQKPLKVWGALCIQEHAVKLALWTSTLFGTFPECQMLQSDLALNEEVSNESNELD